MTGTLTEAVAALRAGEVIAYPTEAVFGLGCDPDNPEAVARLLAIKQRPKSKGLILIAAEESQLDGYIDWSALESERRTLVRASWPGPNTWVMPAGPKATAWLTGDFDTLAVRICGRERARQLCRAFGKPLVSTSANLSGEAPIRRLAEFAGQKALSEQLGAIVSGEVDLNAEPSTIRDARTGQVLRA